jgi:malate dehydrogenase (oxaloacetate-decarboxylating)(NADP+)
MTTDITKAALDYHRQPVAGKISVETTKRMLSQHDLSLAYTPGVAAVCEAIVEDVDAVRDYTARGNLVAVITNGTAVLGLGNIGPYAAKPVMEGKAALFKTFADIDVFDLELDASDPDKFVDAVAALAPTFGGINLEDIKSPECFEIERKLLERLDIPVFHDDQHGTAIVVAAAIRNGLRVAGKRIEDVKLVCSGAGAAAIACLDLLVSMGLSKENVFVCDRKGILYEGRKGTIDLHKIRYMRATRLKTMREAIVGADVFLGLSGPRIIDADDVRQMAERPFILALANPEPEILPEIAHAARNDVVMATGRSDYPNQVNNVLCFPFLFRGALDVGATVINNEMKIACVKALADLTLEESSDCVSAAYRGETFRFGPDYLLPKPFDRRLMSRIAVAVARAAMESGVARRPIRDLVAYRRKLQDYRFRTSTLMRPIFELVRQYRHRIMFAEGESSRVLQALQFIVEEELCRPVLVGRRDRIEAKLDLLGMRLRPERDFGIVDPADDKLLQEDCQCARDWLVGSRLTAQTARELLRTNGTVLSAIRLRRRMVEGVICGVRGGFGINLGYIRSLIGCGENVRDLSTVNLVITRQGPLFVTDTQIAIRPEPEHIMDVVVKAAKLVERFGIKPRVALLAHERDSGLDAEHVQTVNSAIEMLKDCMPGLEVTGEVDIEAALTVPVEDGTPDPLSRAPANLLVMPNLAAAGIALGVMKRVGNAVDVGPILIGSRLPVHILSHAVTVRGIVNMTAMAAADATVECGASATGEIRQEG